MLSSATHGGHLLKAIVSVACSIFVLAGCGQQQTAPSSPSTSVGASEALAQRTEEDRALVDHQAPLRRGLFFKDNYSSLVARSRDGDARATCQLATELDFCAGSAENARYLLDAQERMGKLDASVYGRDSALATISEVARMRNEYCQDVPRATPSERIHYWRLAAERGHLPSVLHYASGRAFQPSETLLLLDELARFRTDALPMMQRAAQSGSYQAALMLARAYEPVSPPDVPPLLKQVIPRPEPARSLAYYLLAEQLAGKRSELPKDVIARLQNDVKRLRDELPANEATEAQNHYRELSAGSVASQSGQELIDQTPYTPMPGTESCEERALVR